MRCSAGILVLEAQASNRQRCVARPYKLRTSLGVLLDCWDPPRWRVIRWSGESQCYLSLSGCLCWVRGGAACRCVRHWRPMYPPHFHMADALGLAPNVSHHLLRGLSCPSLEGFGHSVWYNGPSAARSGPSIEFDFHP